MKKLIRSSIAPLIVFVLLLSGAVQAFTWIQKANFSPGNRYGSYYFSIGNYGYVGSGVMQTGTNYILINDFWEYNSLTDSWAQKASLPGPGRIGAATFTAVNKGYVTTGNDLVTYLDDLWEYEPVTNSWTQKANFPGGPRHTCSSFSVNEYGFVGMGRLVNNYTDFYRYDIMQDLWTPISDAPGPPRQSAKGFTIDGYGYLVGGAEESQQYNSNETYRYDPIGDIWTQMANYPGNGSHGFACFVLYDIAYLGTGTILAATNPVFDDLYSYDPSFNLWLPVSSFNGGIRQGTASMSIGNKGYIGLGSDVIFPAINYQNDWWSFENPTGINEPQHNGINAYIDSDNNFHIDIPESTNDKQVFKLYDDTGRLVENQTVIASQKKLVINLKDHAVGIYCYSLTGAKNQWSGKIALNN